MFAGLYDKAVMDIPVDIISTPSVGSEPCRRENENCGALMPT